MHSVFYFWCETMFVVNAEVISTNEWQTIPDTKRRISTKHTLFFLFPFAINVEVPFKQNDMQTIPNTTSRKSTTHTFLFPFFLAIAVEVTFERTTKCRLSRM